MNNNKKYFLPRDLFDDFIQVIQINCDQVLGPQVIEGAIKYYPISSSSELPTGIMDRQDLGSYRLIMTDSPRQFAWANGVQALKPLLFLPQDVVWVCTQTSDGQVAFDKPLQTIKSTAVLGVRACDLAALALQDKHFLQGEFVDEAYQARREALFLIAVNCSHPASTCFCHSTDDGPNAVSGFDVVLTELDNGFILATGSERAESWLAPLLLTLSPADHDALSLAQVQYESAVAIQQRKLPSGNLEARLFSRLEHSEWQQVAEQCLACGNCTQVCPSCFCHKEEDLAPLGSDATEHVRLWDSCFSDGHGYMAGHQSRPKIADRYRQWMTHKLGAWHSQYGSSGCVGCGRCMTWCPAGIDFVEVANRLCQETP